MKNWTDSQLFDALRDGNKEAMSHLFLRHYDYLMHYGLQISGNRLQVQECLQELFIYLYEASYRLNGINQVRAYLFKSLRRRIIEKVKKEQQKNNSEQRFDKVDILFIREDLEEALVKQEQDRQRLAQALNRLPWRQREAIYLRYYNGLNTREIADIMGAANQTVLNTLYQALQNLRKHLQLKDFIGYCLLWMSSI